MKIRCPATSAVLLNIWLVRKLSRKQTSQIETALRLMASTVSTGITPDVPRRPEMNALSVTMSSTELASRLPSARTIPMMETIGSA